MRRKARIRAKLHRINDDKLRLTVHRTGTHTYAQIIDDKKAITVAAAATVEKDIRANLKNGANVNAAKQVGKILAERALKAGVKTVVFDRSGNLYHGRVKALADAAREAGLSF